MQFGSGVLAFKSKSRQVTMHNVTSENQRCPAEVSGVLHINNHIEC